MTKLSEDDVLKLARLARLELSDEEVQKFKTELSEVLNYVEQLQAVDVSDTNATSQVTGLTNVVRPDVVKDYGVSAEDLLKNAPATENQQIKVRRVL